MSQALRIGIVGCGRLAERGYLPAMRRIRHARLVAVADPVLDRCRELAPGIPAYASAQDLVSAGGIDALILATPANAHLADASVSAAAGLPTLVEKPPATDMAQAIALARLSPAPWIGFNRRFDPRIQRLRATIPRNSIVDLTIEQFHSGGSWQPYVVRDDVLLSIGPHHFDLVRWLTGSEILRVRSADFAARAVSLEIELEHCRAHVRFGNDRQRSDSIEARDANGGVVAHLGTEGFMRRAYSRFARGGANSLVHLLVRQLEEFIDAARGRPANSLATADDGIPVMAAIDATRRSAESGGRWHSLAHFEASEIS